MLDRGISPHLAALKTGRDKALMRVRMRPRGLAYQLSQRARKKIEELWGAGYMLGWLLNLKRLTTLQAAV